jgi:hypothetical protein
MRTYLMPSVALILCSACTSAPATDPANPYQLNEQAACQVRAGRVAEAEILLERAALIAPHDATIRHNRDTLRDYRSGRAISTGTKPAAMTDTSEQQNKPALELPVSLWPDAK